MEMVFIVLLNLFSTINAEPKSCSKRPNITLTNNNTKNIEISESIFYLIKPTELNILCSSTDPIKIKIQTIIPISLLTNNNVLFTRGIEKFSDSETYCHHISFQLPKDHGVTGVYTCESEFHSSSITILSNSYEGSVLLRNGSNGFDISGYPEDDGCIRIPCISTNPNIIPKLHQGNPFKNEIEIVEVTMSNASVEYDIGLGFRICNLYSIQKDYFCQLVYENITSFTSVSLYDTQVGNYYSRMFPSDFVLGSNPGSNTEIHLNVSDNIELKCEANTPIHLSPIPLNSFALYYNIDLTSFYKFTVRLEGVVSNFGEFTINCKANNSNQELRKWNIDVAERKVYADIPGIHLLVNNTYEFTCFSSTTQQPEIRIIECEDPISCNTAKKFAYLIFYQKPNEDNVRFPFKVVPGHACIKERKQVEVPGCAQISHKVVQERGIVVCGERHGTEDHIRTYTQDFVIGINGTIVLLDKVKDNIKKQKLKTNEIIQMEPISDTVYVDQFVTVKCNATYGIFSLGIQLILTLNNGSTITFSDFAALEFHEKLNDVFIMFEAKIKIESGDISKISCFAPLFDSNEWISVNESVTVKVGEIPKIKGEEENVTIIFEYGDSEKFLECEVTGEPFPDVTWYKDQDLLSTKNTKVQSIDSNGNSSILRFRNIVTAHAGTYMCQANNVKSYTSRHFLVTVSGATFNIWVIVGISVTILVFSFIVMIVLIKMIKNRYITERLTENEIHEFEFGNANMANKFAELRENARYLPYKQDFEISKDKIQFLEEELLGSGAFGIVLKGILSKHGESICVAVKTVRPSADISHLRNLLSEIKILMYIGPHPNIIGLLGAMTRELRDGKLHVIVEYCAFGNLQSYLRNNRENYISQIFNGRIDYSINSNKTLKVRPESNISVKSWKLDDFLPADVSDRRRSSASIIKTLDLNNWSFQIANGMEFLAQKKVVHGDLATRNLLLTQNQTIRITDFGLSSHLYDYTNYIKKQKGEPVPWRWLSVEAIRDSKFSVETDVWSYGVTLWEIFTLGQVPYQGYNWGTEFVDALYNGLRLSPPIYSTAHIYEIIRQCWEKEPSERPTFTTLKEFFKNLLPPQT